MVKLENRIRAFEKLGALFAENRSNEFRISNLDEKIKIASSFNPWFTNENIRFSILALAESLKKGNLEKWINPYLKELEQMSSVKTIGVAMAGNIPLVGFHDFLSILMSGHKILAKLSSDDNVLLPAIAHILIDLEPAFKECIAFTESRLQGFDAVIATGSSNTSRYFEYYFSKYPHIIRKNRNGVAVLTGNESSEDLKNLGQDIFQYFGLGCRSVSKVFVPEGYLFDDFFRAIEGFEEVKNHNKYFNNYEYYRSIYLINKVDHFDNGFLMIKNDSEYSSPPSVLYSETYTDLKEIQQKFIADDEKIQCIIGKRGVVKEAVPFGNGQQPELWDYADGVDTMTFLCGL